MKSTTVIPVRTGNSKNLISRFALPLSFVGMVLISFFMHAPHLRKDVVSYHAWRQAQTQATVVNFYEEDMNILNPRRDYRGSGEGIFRMEFPLMQWMIASLYKIFGPDILITRLFMFLTGILGVFGMFLLTSEFTSSKKVGMATAWAFSFSPAFYYYTINPLPDVFALSFGILGLAFFLIWKRKNKNHLLVFSALFLAISALVKLPFILYYAVPGTWLLFGKGYKKGKTFLIFFLSSLLPIFWYAWVIPQWQNGVIAGITGEEMIFSQFLDYLQHNLISTFPELLLNYGSLVFFITAVFWFFKTKAYRLEKTHPFIVLSILLSGYFFYEINMIAKVHDYYLFPFLPVIFLIVAAGIHKIWMLGKRSLIIASVLLLAVLPLTAHLRMQDRWDLNDPGFNPDLITYRQELDEAIPDDVLVVAGSDPSAFILLYYIHKKGWSFEADHLSPELLEKYILEGATFLYDDSNLLKREDFRGLIEERIGRYGTYSIYKLKQTH